MPIRSLTAVMLATVAALPAQNPTENTDVVARVRNGGWFEDSRWRRADDGKLEMNYFADTGKMPDDLHLERYTPLLGEDLTEGLSNCGLLGLIALTCHGRGDLLGMTDGEFHLGALGIDTSEIGLRQYLALPLPSFDGDGGRAELLDRLLAIDMLVRRECKGAVAELHGLARQKVPAPLQAHARRAIARLAGEEDPLARRQLTVDTLALPAVLDVGVVIHHSRLPELAWLTPFARRLSALATLQMIEMAGGSVSEGTRNGAQRITDVVGELPFGLAHLYGNGRIDHSFVGVQARLDAELPFALTWQAAGEFEADGWQDLAISARAARNPLLSGELQIAPDRLQATVGMGAGKPRSTMATKLLQDSGAAIRVIVPPTSKLLGLANLGNLPAIQGAELNITFGDPAVIEVRVDTRGEDDAAEWLEAVPALLTKSRAETEGVLPPAWREDPDVARILAALFAPELSAQGATATATIRLPSIDRVLVRSLVQRLALQSFR